MRTLSLALFGLFLSAACTLAQQQQSPGQQPKNQPPAAAPNDPKLDGYLTRWEQEMKNINTLSMECTRTDVNKTFQYKDTYTGGAKYMKPNLALLEMRQVGKPEKFEKFICTGTYLYQFAPQQKEIRAHQLPAKKEGQVGDDNFLSFLFGMKAEEAKRRYDLRLDREDQYYIYVKVFPRFPADKADFQEARLVLNKDSYMPRQLWFVHANGDETTWDIPRIQPGAQLKRDDFSVPQVPRDWKMVQVPKADEMQPRVYRPQK
jgi:TIGR03009 family protein